MMTIIPRSQVPADLIENAMITVFEGSQKPDYYKFDHMYAFHDEDSNPISFAFIQELTSEHAYFAFGGTVPECRGAVSLRNTRDIVESLKARNFKEVSAHVKSKNFPMLKIFLALKFEITGMRQNANKEILVEMTKNLQENT